MVQIHGTTSTRSLTKRKPPARNLRSSVLPPPPLPGLAPAATSSLWFGHHEGGDDAAVLTEGAEAIAIQALGFIASDPELLPRFLSITGIEAFAIRQAAQE